jgi:hypothetical protein
VWEYRVTVVIWREIEDYLNSMAKVGWELHTLLQSSTGGYRLVLRRRLHGIVKA